MFPLLPLDFIVTVLVVTLFTLIGRWIRSCQRRLDENDQLDNVEL
jgi:hypothetical protein